MRRGAKPPKPKTKRAVARRLPENDGSRVRDLEKRLTEALAQLQTRDRELAEAREQRTATSEILRVIASSPTDEQPVFETIVASALRLLNAHSAGLRTLHGNELHSGAFTSTTPSGDSALAQGPIAVILVSSSAHFTRVVKDRTPSVVEDTETDSGLPPGYRQVARARGYRSGLAVPLLRGETVLGLINVTRRAPGPFSADDIALLQTFADQAVIAIENVRLFTELQASNCELTTALDKQTATSDILRVISQSPTNVQPVFDAIVASAVRLLHGYFGAMTRVVGDRLERVAVTTTTETEDLGTATWRQPLHNEGVHAKAIRDGEPVNIADALTEPGVSGELGRRARAIGYRSLAAVPLFRHDQALGTIAVTRREPGGFTDDEIALLQTFADQAVIAIENVRLFSELQASNAELTGALDRQTATSEILQVISRSPTEVQAVFETIVRNAVRLCGASHGGVYRFDGQLIHSVAHEGFTPEDLKAWRRTWPQPVTSATIIGFAITNKRIVRIGDIDTAPELANLDPDRRANLRARGSRSLVAVPMRRKDDIIGAIGLAHREVNAFSDTHVELLQTFADQAVIAIENVRLFRELAARNTELTDTLARESATGEVLRAISRAQTDAQPVFDIIAESAQRLCDAGYGQVALYDGALLHMTAFHNVNAEGMEALRRRFPAPADRGSAMGRALQTRAVVQIPDVREDLAYAFKSELQTMGFQSLLVVPMLRKDEPIGAIAVGRRERGAFPDKQIELLQTFADQAVIAIENVRLFKELEARTEDLTRSVGELRALGEVGQAISSSLDLRTVLSTIVARATQLSGTDAGVIYEYDEECEVFVPRATAHVEVEIVETMLAAPVRKGEGATGRLAEVQEPNQVPDISVSPADSRVRGALVRAGYRALLAVPLVRDNHLLGGLTVVRKMPGQFPGETIELLQTFATQSALAIQNARLFREIEEKSRELEVASQHKSEFLANMSHELRTPLNAIIGFSEVLGERLFGELNAKQEEYLKDIHASGQHLLSLINDILDLSKIEAGRMELELTDFDLPTAIDNALTLVRERAGRRGIALHQATDEGLGQIRGDERKIKQVLLNLLSNAIKFTPEGGRIEIRAKSVNGSIEVSVTDTGVGIAPEDQEAIFEEFRQVGTADKKVEGTGLGLALSRKFIELHGGRIWVKSEVGAGATFTFTLPRGLA